MATIINPKRLGQALLAQGLLPARCRNVQLHIDANAVPIIRYEIMLNQDDMNKLAAAFEAIDADLKAEAKP